MKKITVDLSTKSIKDLKQRLQTALESTKQVGNDIAQELANRCETNIQRNYASKEYRDGNDDWEVFQEKLEDGHYKTGVRGSQVLYNEFGTGTEGERNPHPIKNEFKLNDYNSGSTIRPASATISQQTGIKEGELYWTYKDKNGDIVYTQGIPAGKEVYNASTELEKDKKEVIKDKVGGIISKL